MCVFGYNSYSVGASFFSFSSCVFFLFSITRSFCCCCCSFRLTKSKVCERWCWFFRSRPAFLYSFCTEDSFLRLSLHAFQIFPTTKPSNRSNTRTRIYRAWGSDDDDDDNNGNDGKHTAKANDRNLFATEIRTRKA